MTDRDFDIEETMEIIDRLVAWATELKRQPLTDRLTVHQAGVLHLSVKTGPMGLDELGRLLGSVPSTVSALIDRLEAKGFIRRVRNPADGRRFTIEATSAGQRQYAEIESRSRAFSRALFQAWDFVEIRSLRALLERFVQDANGLSFTATNESASGTLPAENGVHS